VKIEVSHKPEWLRTTRRADWVAICPVQRKGNSKMETLQQFMYAFYGVLMLAAGGICVWFYKKRKENDR
jgi:hypothetical protein